MKPGIAVLGAGRMGSALIKAFLKQGYRTAIWNRTRARSEPLAALGACIAPSVKDAVADAEVVVVNVIDYAASDALLRTEEVTQALRGKVLVQLTSGSPKQAREAAEWARAHDIHYLDGAIMGTPDFIGQPGATILYAGPSEPFEKYKPVFLALGGNAQYVGRDVGHASALDSSLLVVMWGAMFGALQATAICEAEGIPLGAFREYLKPVMPVVDGAVDDTVTRIQQRQFSGETSLATLEAHHVAFEHLLELTREHGIHSAVPDAFEQLFQAAIRAGQGREDFAVLSTFMRRA
ncbi:NAD(P)-dependent oxidoreductase [Pyxidicoccus xibeiensis]|uniref:NAD(P)-dependent oxidoreductase n=1 Tax=Pyxidicoccus xibeiensis TaxID=2906759 RepID=UPI0020A709BC|nr:NAD(P)-binding domain-containing protein [Pyxidicoccus xibeiensis]MCP3140397.1 NAD(P)-binding domain-containing protein [Pyxidicoccus xibeiensis]